MTYIVEVWGVQEDDTEFKARFETKSTRIKVWAGKMRDKFEGKINFDKFKDFQYRLTPK